MITLLVRRRRKKVAELAAHIDQERRQLRDMTRRGHARLADHLRGDWALVGCFAAGFLTGRMGSRLLRPLASALRAIPYWRLAQKLRPYLPI